MIYDNELWITCWIHGNRSSAEVKGNAFILFGCNVWASDIPRRNPESRLSPVAS